MDKNNVFKIGKLIGLATAVSLALYTKMKKKIPQEEVIDITPEKEIEEARN